MEYEGLCRDDKPDVLHGRALQFVSNRHRYVLPAPAQLGPADWLALYPLGTTAIWLQKLYISDPPDDPDHLVSPWLEGKLLSRALAAVPAFQ